MRLECEARPDRMSEAGFDDASDPLARLDLTGRFIAINPAFARVVGYDEARFCRTIWPSPLDRDDFADQLDELCRLAAGRLEAISVKSTYMTGHGLMVQLVGRLELVRDGSRAHLLMTLDRRPVSAAAQAA